MALFWRKSSTLGPAAPVPAAAREVNPWRAVAIMAKSTCCEAARSLHAKRFLSAQAPRLPLASCNQADSCPCAYRHHEDRRGLPRRKEERTGLRQSVKVSQERRLGGSRRKAD
jgi:hypothetical protein